MKITEIIKFNFTLAEQLTALSFPDTLDPIRDSNDPKLDFRTRLQLADSGSL